MIDPGKLTQLEGGQKRRKLALTLGALERDIDGVLLGIIAGAAIYAATTLVLRTDTALMLAETIKKRIIKVKKC